MARDLRCDQLDVASGYHDQTVLKAAGVSVVCFVLEDILPASQVYILAERLTGSFPISPQ